MALCSLRLVDRGWLRFFCLCGILCSLGHSCVPSSRIVPGSVLNILDIQVGSQARKVLVYYPKNRSLDLPLKGLVTFHGWHANPWADVIEYMNQTVYAERYGFALAIPFGTPTQGAPSPICCNKYFPSPQACAAMKPCEYTWDNDRPCGWNSFPGRSSNWSSGTPPDDAALARAAAKLLVDEACVRESHVFAMGFSGGSMMANTLACTEAGTFMGVAGVSGALAIPSAQCNPSKPISYLSFSGTEDEGSFPTHEERFSTFLRKNGCKDVRRTTFLTSTTFCEAVDECPSGIYMEQCIIYGIGDMMPGHNRTIDFGPGSKQPLTNVDAVDRIFSIFSKLSAREPTGSSTVRTASAPPSSGTTQGALPIQV
eukprot:TRINITY_DN15686_c0_g1_i1.p1 TRINITY_DN15686_c0_g1~~TRINITY_DN15686_c0_g1_i1.p1  ORF type:complete len:369 (+),score=49.71 TRINITY_DN15686_c0_g1_i1:56-1162(+)